MRFGDACRDAPRRQRLFGGAVRIVIILPRGMCFGPKGATAIDLCVRDLIRHSAYRRTTTILGEPVDQPFGDVDFQAVSTASARTAESAARAFAEAARRLDPDIVVVHQHLPIAAGIARRLNAPVLLHRHGRVGSMSPVRRLRHWSRYRRFAKTIWVSQDARRSFELQFPSLAQHACTIYNGLDFDEWSPRSVRDKLVLFVGRASPEKGVIQAAQGVARALRAQQDWRALFILSRLDGHDDYLSEINEELSPLGNRVSVRFDVEHSDVKAAFERAAVVLVPSLIAEAFGRTALEAGAGGAALISSGSGGLSEITGDDALTLPTVTPGTIAHSLRSLINNETMQRDIAGALRSRVASKFDIRTVAQALDAVFDEALATSRQLRK